MQCSARRRGRRRRPRKCCPVILRSNAWQTQSNQRGGRRRESRLPLHLALGSCKVRYAASPAVPRAIHHMSPTERIRESVRVTEDVELRLGLESRCKGTHSTCHSRAPFRSTAGRTDVTLVPHDLAVTILQESQAMVLGAQDIDVLRSPGARWDGRSIADGTTVADGCHLSHAPSGLECRTGANFLGHSQSQKT